MFKQRQWTVAGGENEDVLCETFNTNVLQMSWSFLQFFSIYSLLFTLFNLFFGGKKLMLVAFLSFFSENFPAKSNFVENILKSILEMFLIRLDQRYSI